MSTTNGGEDWYGLLSLSITNLDRLSHNKNSNQISQGKYASSNSFRETRKGWKKKPQERTKRMEDFNTH